MAEYTKYTECQLADIIQTFYKEMGDLIEFIMTMFKEPNKNKKGFPFTKIPRIDVQYQVFDSFLKKNGITDPYRQCAFFKPD